MDKCNLNFIEVPFGKDTRIGKRKDEAEFLFGLTNQYVYLVIGRIVNDEKNDPIILETINYYSMLRKEEDNFSKDWYSFNILDNNYYPKYYIESHVVHGMRNYTILKLDSNSALNFFLSTATDDDLIHVFSSDYNIDEIKKLLIGISKEENFITESFFCMYQNIFKTKRFLVFDMEDSMDGSGGFLLISDQNISLNLLF